MLIILRTKKWGSLFLVVHRKGGHTTTLNDYMLQTIPPRRHLANKSQTTTDQSGRNVLWGSSMAILSFCGDVVVIAALNASLMGQSCEFILKSVSSSN